MSDFPVFSHKVSHKVSSLFVNLFSHSSISSLLKQYPSLWTKRENLTVCTTITTTSPTNRLTNTSDISKRDRKRLQVTSRLQKLDATLLSEKDNLYGLQLHSLQNDLATLQQGNNPHLLEARESMEEDRDNELTRLRLWEEYQVKRSEIEYQLDLSTAKDNHDKMIKLIKEKLYDKLQNEIKQLKEDKLLLNLVNANSWNNSQYQPSQDATTVALNAVAGHALQDRRSLRKREFGPRFTAGEAEDLSDSGGSGFLNGGKGYISSSGKRRRHYATRYSSNDEMSGTTTAGAGGSSKLSHQHNGSGASSGNDSNLSDKDYDALNTIIMNYEDGGVSLILKDNHQANTNKTNTRTQKQFVGVSGLKPEELNDDLTLLRNATGRN